MGPRGLRPAHPVAGDRPRPPRCSWFLRRSIATSALKRWHLISGPWLSQVLARPRRGGAFRLRGTLVGLATRPTGGRV